MLSETSTAIMIILGVAILILAVFVISILLGIAEAIEEILELKGKE